MPTAPVPQIVQGHAGLVSVDGREYPIESVTLEARAEGGVALTTLTQQFRNPHAEPLEVVYSLPLPADGAVIGYDVLVGERPIRGEVRRREEALQEYRDALYDGRLAALLEQDRDDTFSQRLGSVPPGVGVRIEVHVLQPLASVVTGGEKGPRWEYRFPTVVGVRYHGEPGRVPDRERIDPDRGEGGAIPTRIGLSLELADGVPAEIAPQSPSHSLVTTSSGNGTHVTLAESSRLDRDLVVTWKASAPRTALHVREGGGLAGDEGRYALVTLTPPTVPDAVLPRDLTLLLDASGSMQGAALAASQRIATALLRSLGPQDRFEVLVFSNAVHRLTRGLEPAKEKTVSAVTKAIQGLRADGGTEMRKAIVEALTPLRDDAQRQVVLLTDGQIGFEGEVVSEILQRSPVGCRLHVVGVGPAPNRSLTRAASRAAGGVEVLAASEAQAEEAAARLVHATHRPVLTDLVVGGTAVAGVAPARPRDVLAGSPTWIAVSLTAAGGTLLVRGRLAGSSEPWTQAVTIPASASRETPFPLGALFGREAVADLEIRLAAEPDTGILGEIEQLGLRHRIATRRTSLIAVAEEASVDPLAPRRVEVLPVEVPEGLSAEGLGLRSAAFQTFGLTERRRIALGIPPADAPLVVGSPILKRVEFEGQFEDEAADALAAQSSAPGAAWVLRAEDDALVIEFVCGGDGFLLPMEGVTVEVHGEVHGVEIVAERSSPRGPHRLGTVVRLALRLLTGKREWKAGEELLLRWTSGEEHIDLSIGVSAEAIARR